MLKNQQYSVDISSFYELTDEMVLLKRQQNANIFAKRLLEIRVSEFYFGEDPNSMLISLKRVFLHRNTTFSRAKKKMTRWKKLTSS